MHDLPHDTSPSDDAAAENPLVAPAARSTDAAPVGPHLSLPILLELLETAHQGVWMLDADARIRYVSPRAAEMLGYSPEQLLGCSVFDFVHESDRAAGERNLARRRGGQADRLEFRFRRRDGSELWADCCGRPLTAGDGSYQGVLVLLTDVTERRAVEQDLRLVAARAHCLLWKADIEEKGEETLGWVIRVMDEEAAERFFPVERRPGEDYAQAWYRSRVADDRGRSDGFGDGQVRQGKSYAQEFRCRRADGETRWMREEVEVETIAPGRWRAVGICLDITSHQRLEEQLRQAQKMEAVGRLAGGVAHDFNNMLAVINGYSGMLLNGDDLEPSLRASLEQIHLAGDRAAGLTRQLLTFSRKQLVITQSVDLNDLLSDLKPLLHRLLGEDVELETRLSPTPVCVLADRSQIDQVVLNLAVNARDAMPTGGRLTIELGKFERTREQAEEQIGVQPGPYVLLSVRDTGQGMDAETLSHIWEPFYSTKGKSGTGLGLATVYGVVHQSGGHVEVFSRCGMGSEFRVFLPLAASPAPPETTSPIPPAAPAGTETILLVEDEAMVRSLITTVLQGCGYRVMAAGSGEDALETATREEGRFDLLLTDVVLPGVISGRLLAERMRKRFPSLRVLYMSGYTDDAVLRHGIATEESAFLPKPFTPLDLTRKVRELLDEV